MLLELSDTLSTLVHNKFASAKTSQSLIFSHTELTIIRTSTGIPFQLRYCPALAKKPEASSNLKKDKVDPFDNPPAELLIAEIPTSTPSHILVLNKYPIIAGHFILATKTNKQQTHVLERDDLEATYACLKAWETHDESKRLFAFFNSGEHSGASQPHRHLQFLPVESMREGEQENEPWELLLDIILSAATPDKNATKTNLLQHPDLPFSHFAIRFPTSPTAAYLLHAYNTLYQAAKDSVDAFIASSKDSVSFSLHATDSGSLPISYNLAMTTAGMAIVPRRSEGSMLKRDDGTEIGFVQLNGTTLGGTMLVKYPELWEALRARPDGLDDILRDIGIPRML